MSGGSDREAPRAPASHATDEVAAKGRPLPPGVGEGNDPEAPPQPAQAGEGLDPGAPLAARPDKGQDPEAPLAAGPGTGQDPEAPTLPTRVGRGTDPERGFRIAAMVVKPLMRTWFRIRLEGHEHIPEAGPVILASNHRSNMDPVLLAAAVERPVAFMAKAELFVGPLGWIMRWIGQFPVRRGGIDREALRRVDAVLARGSVLGLFPEGTRGDGTFSSVHPGLAYIVVRQHCPVLPVVISGTERVRRRFGWLPFASPVRIVIGPPIDLPQSTSDRAGRRAASEVLRQRLHAFRAAIMGEPTAAPTTNLQIDE